MLLSEAVCIALIAALALDAVAGEPAWLYRRLAHPVVIIGKAIAFLERRLWSQAASASSLYRRGRQLTLLVALTAVLFGLALQALLLALPYGPILLGVAMSTLLAQRSLVQHVDRVADGLELGLEPGRQAVSQIVGREVAQLDDAGVARAAIESGAENFADGVVAPLVWALLFGLPGMIAYKAINTADSMIGHESRRYQDFGRFAALLDDAVNWLPARLAAYLLVFAAALLPGADSSDALRVMRRYGRRHRSPNAGWPEAAMAGALGLRLGGPRCYKGVRRADPWIGASRKKAESHDIRRAIKLIWRAWLVLPLLVTGLYLLG